MELVLPRCSQGNPGQTVLFVPEKQPTSNCIGWSEPVAGRDLRPLESKRLFTPHYFANYRREGTVGTICSDASEVNHDRRNHHNCER
jgi:hypothetical protein